MPTRVTLSNGTDADLNDMPNEHGEYIATSGGNSYVVDSIDAHRALNRQREIDAAKAAEYARIPTDFMNAAKAGYDASGADASLRRLQGSWTTMWLAIFWRLGRYYLRALFKGPMGERLGVIAGFVIGFIIVGSAGAGPGMTDNALIGTLVFLFGGRLLGPLGGWVERTFVASRSAKAS